jgi:hypothetical protein
MAIDSHNQCGKKGNEYKCGTKSPKKNSLCFLIGQTKQNPILFQLFDEDATFKILGFSENSKTNSEEERMDRQ